MKIIQSAFDKYVDTKLAFEKMGRNKFKDCKIHVVYAGPYYRHSCQALRSSIINAMKKCKLDIVRVTKIDMSRRYLITQEEMVDFCLGKMKYHKKSINDDIELLFECIRLGEEFDKGVSTYFLPKLTNEELKLVEIKDPKYLATMNNTGIGPTPWTDPLVKEYSLRQAEMKLSESKSRFVMVACHQDTFTINLNNEAEDLNPLTRD